MRHVLTAAIALVLAASHANVVQRPLGRLPTDEITGFFGWSGERVGDDYLIGAGDCSSGSVWTMTRETAPVDYPTPATTALDCAVGDCLRTGGGLAVLELDDPGHDVWNPNADGTFCLLYRWNETISGPDGGSHDPDYGAFFVSSTDAFEDYTSVQANHSVDATQSGEFCDPGAGWGWTISDTGSGGPARTLYSDTFGVGCVRNDDDGVQDCHGESDCICNQQAHTWYAACHRQDYTSGSPPTREVAYSIWELADGGWSPVCSAGTVRSAASGDAIADIDTDWLWFGWTSDRSYFDVQIDTVLFIQGLADLSDARNLLLYSRAPGGACP